MFHPLRLTNCSTGYAVRTMALALYLAGPQRSPGCCAQTRAENAPTEATDAVESEKVLRHAVFFKFKPTSSKEDVARVVQAFRELPMKIRVIREFQLGESIAESGRNDGFTHGFLLSFADEAGRAAYLPHPDHKAFGSALGPHLAGVFVIDYWGVSQDDGSNKPLKHAVFFKFKDGTSDDDIRAVETGLAGLPAKIETIKAFEWGTNNSPETHDQGFTHCFMFTFDSTEGLKNYSDHPAHRAEAARLIPLMDKIRVIDFWAENVPVSKGK